MDEFAPADISHQQPLDGPATVTTSRAKHLRVMRLAVAGLAGQRWPERFSCSWAVSRCWSSRTQRGSSGSCSPAPSSPALGYRGSLQVVDEIAPEDRRAELVTSYLLVCSAGNALPVVGVGVLSRAVGPELAHRIFAGVLAVLGLLAGGIGASRKFIRAGTAG